MKLRIDLLQDITDEDVIEEALAISPRYEPEPVFSRTGRGHLAPATSEQIAEDLERSGLRIQRIEQRAQR